MSNQLKETIDNGIMLATHIHKVVEAMAFANESVQRFLLKRILMLSEKLFVKQNTGRYSYYLDADIKTALMKAKTTQQWQDQNDELIKAFDHLSGLRRTERNEISMILVTPIRIIKGYEYYCESLNQKPDLGIVDEILRTSLIAGPRRAEKLYQIYLIFEQETRMQQQAQQASQKKRYVPKKPRWYEPSNCLKDMVNKHIVASLSAFNFSKTKQPEPKADTVSHSDKAAPAITESENRPTTQNTSEQAQLRVPFKPKDNHSETSNYRLTELILLEEVAQSVNQKAG